MVPSPPSSELSIEEGTSVPLPQSTTVDLAVNKENISNVNKRELVSEGKGAKRFGRKSQRATYSSILQTWDQPALPYHEYVRHLIAAGWDNLKELDDYMSRQIVTNHLTVSVLDITSDGHIKRWPDIHYEEELSKFLNQKSRDGTKVRFYMVEKDGDFSASMMDAFGSSLRLDPRFFLEIVTENKSFLRPSQQHRAPFIHIQFMIPKEWKDPKDLDRFIVSVYIQPDEDGSGWTG
jgi:hypothetical protein